LAAAANKVSTRILPNWFIRVVALASPPMLGIVPHLGVNMNASGQKASRLLDWKPRSREEAILATAESSSISDIAAETGFSHASHLARWTRRLLGVSPGELKRG
jgi:hypothetical protein